MPSSDKDSLDTCVGATLAPMTASFRLERDDEVLFDRVALKETFSELRPTLPSDTWDGDQ